MWFEKFLNIIRRYFPVNPLAGIEDHIAELRPEKIYVENVRSILGVSQPTALQICETAVRQGVFDRKIEILSPDGSVAWIGNNPEDVPPTLPVWIDEDGHLEEANVPTTKLKKNSFYRLHDRCQACPAPA